MHSIWQLKITLKNIFNIRHWWNQSYYYAYYFFVTFQKEIKTSSSITKKYTF